jgi:hypothetical protein
MKYLCLISYEEQTLDALSTRELDALIDEAFAYDEVLRKSGHYLVSEALQPVRTATTVRIRNGQVSVTNGPYAETREQCGGLFPIETPQPERRHPGRLDDPVGTHGQPRGASDVQPRGAVIAGGCIVRSHRCVRHA